MKERSIQSSPVRIRWLFYQICPVYQAFSIQKIIMFFEIARYKLSQLHRDLSARKRESCREEEN
jgi:hypothetical protein